MYPFPFNKNGIVYVKGCGGRNRSKMYPTSDEVKGLGEIAPREGKVVVDWPSPRNTSSFLRELMERMEAAWCLGKVQYSITPHENNKNIPGGVVSPLTDLLLWYSPEGTSTIAVRSIPLHPIEYDGVWWYKQPDTSKQNNTTSLITLYVLLPEPEPYNPRRLHMKCKLKEAVYFLPVLHSNTEHQSSWSFPMRVMKEKIMNKVRSCVCRMNSCLHQTYASMVIPGSRLHDLADVFKAELNIKDIITDKTPGEQIITRAVSPLIGSTKPSINNTSNCPICSQYVSDISHHMIESHWRSEISSSALSDLDVSNVLSSEDSKWLGL